LVGFGRQDKTELLLVLPTYITSTLVNTLLLFLLVNMQRYPKEWQVCRTRAEQSHSIEVRCFTYLHGWGTHYQP